MDFFKLAALALITAACSNEQVPVTDDETAVEVTPTCQPPAPVEYLVDQNATDAERGVIIAAIESWNFSENIAVSYQGTSTSWNSTMKVETRTVFLLRTEEEVVASQKKYAGCGDSKTTAGCGTPDGAYVYASRLMRSSPTLGSYHLALSFVAAHEFGHVLLGASHIANAGSLMNGTARFENAALSDYDRGWFCSVYCCADAYPDVGERY